MNENPSDTYNDDRYSMSSFPNPGILAHCNDFHILPSEIIITFAPHSIIIPTKTHSVMNDLQIIQSKIYELRGQKVMLDFDLANLYGVETSQLKRAVRRNIERFEGDDFMFEITHDEFLRCQIGTSNGRGGTRYMPFAFTELGVAMLSSVLKSSTAIEINRGIMRAFVAIRKMIAPNSINQRLSSLENDFKELKQDLEEIFTDYNDINEDTRAQLEAINTTLAELQTTRKETPRRRIGFSE